MSLLPSATFATSIAPTGGASDYAANALWATAGAAGPGGGVTQLVAGANITLDPPTGEGVVTITAAGAAGGVTSVTSGGPGITCIPTTGAVVVDNTGVTSIVAGSNISVSGSTGAVTITAIPTPVFAKQVVNQNYNSGVAVVNLPGDNTISVWSGLRLISNFPASLTQSWALSIPGITPNANDTYLVQVDDLLYDSVGGFYINASYAVASGGGTLVNITQVTNSIVNTANGPSCRVSLIRLKGQ